MSDLSEDQAKKNNNFEDTLPETGSETSSEIASTWNTGQEELLAAIGDRSNCMRWMHSKCQDTYAWYNFAFTLPSIAVSSLVGSLTMSLPSLTDADNTRNATTALGLLGIGVGVLTSINQYMKCAQLTEAHRAAAVAYGKLHRSILNELALRRDQRSNALDYLKAVRIEQDRLQENSPIILDSVISKFNKAFKDNTLLEKPEIAGDLDHVQVNRTMKPSHVITAESSDNVYSLKTNGIFPSSPKIASSSSLTSNYNNTSSAKSTNKVTPIMTTPLLNNYFSSPLNEILDPTSKYLEPKQHAVVDSSVVISAHDIHPTYKNSEKPLTPIQVNIENGTLNIN